MKKSLSFVISFLFGFLMFITLKSFSFILDKKDQFDVLFFITLFLLFIQISFFFNFKENGFKKRKLRFMSRLLILADFIFLFFIGLTYSSNLFLPSIFGEIYIFIIACLSMLSAFLIFFLISE